MTKDFHPGCSFDKGRHPRPRRGERLTQNSEDETPESKSGKYELENSISKIQMRDSNSNVRNMN